MCLCQGIQTGYRIVLFVVNKPIIWLFLCMTSNRIGKKLVWEQKYKKRWLNTPKVFFDIIIWNMKYKTSTFI